MSKEIKVIITDDLLAAIDARVKNEKAANIATDRSKFIRRAIHYYLDKQNSTNHFAIGG
jgi:metal-responsive CopG/Arc/MetJ family transcriptional regulator